MICGLIWCQDCGVAIRPETDEYMVQDRTGKKLCVKCADDYIDVTTVRPEAAPVHVGTVRGE